MARVYLCKVNVNNKTMLTDGDKVKQSEDMINKCAMLMDTAENYELPKDKGLIKFITIDKYLDKGYITGRVIRIFSDDIKVYDAKTDDVRELRNKELARTATFYFDILHEYVAFTTGQFFGRNQFCNYFETLLNLHMKEQVFKVMLITDTDELIKKIQGLNKIDRLDITIIPENPGRDEIDELYATPQIMKDVNATELAQSFISKKDDVKGLVVSSEAPFFKSVFNALKRGYGRMVVTGYGSDYSSVTIKSDVNSPVTKDIPDNEKFSISSVADYGRALINRFLSKRAEK